MYLIYCLLILNIYFDRKIIYTACRNVINALDLIDFFLINLTFTVSCIKKDVFTYWLVYFIICQKTNWSTLLCVLHREYECYPIIIASAGQCLSQQSISTNDDFQSAFQILLNLIHEQMDLKLHISKCFYTYNIIIKRINITEKF